jgi:hypothetical protein
MAAPGSSHFFLIGRLGSSMTTVDPHYPRRAMVAKIAAIHGGAQLTIALPAPAKWIAIYILLRYDTVSYRCFVLLVEIIIFSLVFVAIYYMRCILPMHSHTSSILHIHLGCGSGILANFHMKS